MKYIEDPDVTCPFYQRENGSRLTCEGIANCSSNITVFHVKKDLVKHKARYCQRSYGDCILCQALLTKYA